MAGRCSSLARLGLAAPARGPASPQCTTLSHPADARRRCRPRTSPPTDGVAGADLERETNPFQRARRASAAASSVTRPLSSSNSFSVIYSYVARLGFTFFAFSACLNGSGSAKMNQADLRLLTAGFCLFSSCLKSAAAYDVHHVRQSLLRGLSREAESLLRDQRIHMAYGKQSEMPAKCP